MKRFRHRSGADSREAACSRRKDPAGTAPTSGEIPRARRLPTGLAGSEIKTGKSRHEPAALPEADGRVEKAIAPHGRKAEPRITARAVIDRPPIRAIVDVITARSDGDSANRREHESPVMNANAVHGPGTVRQAQLRSPSVVRNTPNHNPMPRQRDSYRARSSSLHHYSSGTSTPTSPVFRSTP
jgi:hypothetical protein